MKKKLIDYHYEWLETNTIPCKGLCNSLKKINPKYRRKLEEFNPTIEDIKVLFKENKTRLFWGADVSIHHVPYREIETQYTELRQTIVLFICAMCNEL